MGEELLENAGGQGQDLPGVVHGELARQNPWANTTRKKILKIVQCFTHILLSEAEEGFPSCTL